MRPFAFPDLSVPENNLILWSLGSHLLEKISLTVKSQFCGCFDSGRLEVRYAGKHFNKQAQGNPRFPDAAGTARCEAADNKTQTLHDFGRL